VARFEGVAFAKPRDDVVAADLGSDLQFGAGRLDHLDLGLGAIVGDDEMLRPDAVHGLASVAASRRTGKGKTNAARAFKLRPAVRADHSFEKVHRRRTD